MQNPQYSKPETFSFYTFLSGNEKGEEFSEAVLEAVK